MKTKSIFFLATVLIISILFNVQTYQASASVTWEEFMTQSEAKAIKKMVKKAIKNELKDPNEDWENIIDKDAVEDNITKQKVYSATAPSGVDGADYTVCLELDADECDYYDAVEVDEIDVSKTPQVSVLYEVDDTDWKTDTGFTVTYSYLNPSYIMLRNGYVYVKYGFGEGDFTGLFTDYRIVVNY